MEFAKLLFMVCYSWLIEYIYLPGSCGEWTGVDISTLPKPKQGKKVSDQMFILGDLKATQI